MVLPVKRRVPLNDGTDVLLDWNLSPDVQIVFPSGKITLKARVNGDHLRLTWNAAEDESPGSWVVGYRVCRNGDSVGTAFGLQFFVFDGIVFLWGC